MNVKFDFFVDNESKEFCVEIVEEMVREFGLNREEAIGRLNRQWRGNDFTGEDDIRYHETSNFWANEIYYGSDSNWWKGYKDLKPIPYP